MTFNYYDSAYAHNDGRVSANHASNLIMFGASLLAMIPFCVWAFLINDDGPLAPGPLVGLSRWLKIGVPLVWVFFVLFVALWLSMVAVALEGRHYRNHGLKPGAWRQ